MDVILCEGGFTIDVSPNVMREYVKRKGLKAWLYGYPDTDIGGDQRMCPKLDEDDNNSFFFTVNQDLGEFATILTLKTHLLSDVTPFSRTDEVLISVLKDMGKLANWYARLYIATIPDGIQWFINMDGGDYVWREFVEEGVPQRNRTWYGESVI